MLAGVLPHMVTRLLAVLALVAAAGTIGVMVGHTAVKRADKGYLNGYHAGQRAQRSGNAANIHRSLARYEPGQPGFESIYSAGRREGHRLGRRLGRSEGLSAARKRFATLPDFPGGWRAQHWYLVRLEPGTKGLRIGRRVLISRGHVYGPCR